MKLYLILTLLFNSLAFSYVTTVIKVDVAKLASFGVPIPPNTTDQIQVMVRPTNNTITSVRLIVDIQVDGDFIHFDKALETNGNSPLFIIPVKSSTRAVIVYKKVIERVDTNTAEDVQ